MTKKTGKNPSPKTSPASPLGPAATPTSLSPIPTTSTSTTTTPADDLDQLLLGLRLSRLRAILGRELAHAEAQGPSYSDFLARLLREEYQHQQERFTEYRIARAGLPERWAVRGERDLRGRLTRSQVRAGTRPAYAQVRAGRRGAGARAG